MSLHHKQYCDSDCSSLFRPSGILLSMLWHCHPCFVPVFQTSNATNSDCSFVSALMALFPATLFMDVSWP